MNYLGKMRGCPQFSFWISMTLVKIYIPCIIINRGKNTIELVGTVLKAMRLTCCMSSYKARSSTVIGWFLTVVCSSYIYHDEQPKLLFKDWNKLLQLSMITIHWWRIFLWMTCLRPLSWTRSEQHWAPFLLTWKRFAAPNIQFRELYGLLKPSRVILAHSFWRYWTVCRWEAALFVKYLTVIVMLSEHGLHKRETPVPGCSLTCSPVGLKQ